MFLFNFQFLLSPLDLSFVSLIVTFFGNFVLFRLRFDVRSFAFLVLFHSNVFILVSLYLESFIKIDKIKYVTRRYFHTRWHFFALLNRDVFVSFGCFVHFTQQQKKASLGRFDHSKLNDKQTADLRRDTQKDAWIFYFLIWNRPQLWAVIITVTQ